MSSNPESQRIVASQLNPSRLTARASFAFDVLRILGAEMVVVGHALSFAKADAAFSPPNSVYMQNVGVVLFFIVSGFLISKSAADNLAKPQGSYTFASFLLDRATRIYCGLVPALVIITLVDAVQYGFFHYTHSSAFNFQTALANLAFLQDYPKLPFTSFGSGRPLWTLSIEWWLYIGFGAIFLPWPKNRVGSILVAALTTIAAPVVLLNLVHGRGDGLAAFWIIGAAAVWLLPRLPQVRMAAVSGFFGLAVLLLFRDARLVDYDFHFNVVLAFFVISLIGMLNTNAAPVWKPLHTTARYGAGYSYTLYLTHYSILELLHQLPGLGSYGLLITGVITCNLIAAAVAHLGETKYKKVRAFLRNRIPIGAPAY
jgi:peptidoglycan/LPS O-acetylase OafA/YrhL